MQAIQIGSKVTVNAQGEDFSFINTPGIVLGFDRDTRLFRVYLPTEINHDRRDFEARDITLAA